MIGKKNISIHVYTSLAYAYAKVGRLDAVWDIITTIERDTLLKTDAILYTGKWSGKERGDGKDQ